MSSSERTPEFETYSDWLARLRSEQFGRLWFCKFEYDLNNDNIPADVEAKFRSIVEARLKALDPAAHPLGLIESIIVEHPTEFDLKGLRIPHKRGPYSLVVKLEVFSLHYLNRRALFTILDDSDDEFEFVWTNMGGRITPKYYKGQVRTKRDFFWCAETEEFEKVVAMHPDDQAATTLRDRLGLPDMGKGQRLIRIDVPNDALKGKKLCAPTTLDSGINPTFVPCNDDRGFGRTLNLKTITRDVREVIVEEIPFDKTFTAAKVGKISEDVPSIPWDDVETLVR